MKYKYVTCEADAQFQASQLRAQGYASYWMYMGMGSYQIRYWL